MQKVYDFRIRKNKKIIEEKWKVWYTLNNVKKQEGIKWKEKSSLKKRKIILKIYFPGLVFLYFHLIYQVFLTVFNIIGNRGYN